MYHGLADYVDVVCVILENKPPGKTLIQRRIKKIGALKAIGQFLFLIFNKSFSKTSKARVKQLVFDLDLNDENFPVDIVKEVDSVNSKEVTNLLKNINPDAVVVNGTRIISKRVISSVDAPFINTHMGITPKYRGVHGGYWALANADPDNCGVTVHLVDQGVDTGGVLYQDIIRINKHDNLNTYPVYQIAKAIPLMKAALNDLKQNRIYVKQGVFPSHLWYHPTLFEYLKNWVQKGVR